MTPCYTRHETAPGVHADIPHEHERHDMSENPQPSIIRQLLEDAHTWPADEREFYIQRVEAKERHSRERCWGISSDAMTHYALGMTGAPTKGQYPADRGDLAACERTFAMAPPRLQSIMKPILVGYRAHVAERYPS